MPLEKNENEDISIRQDFNNILWIEYINDKQKTAMHT